ncbi:Glycosyltransferase WbuB [Candidatus Magnetomoraceae bacterium gMMP-1]
MKILYHHRTLGHGAEGIHIASMVNAFRNIGHEVKVFSLIGSDPYNRKKRAKFWEIISNLTPKIIYEIMAIGYNFIGYQKIRNLIKEFCPDIVYERYATHCFSCALACKQAGIPHLLEINSPLSYEQIEFQGEKRLLSNFFVKKTESWICSNSTVTLAVSSPLKKYLIENLGVPEKKVVVLPNGVDLNLFVNYLKKYNIREKYNLQNKIVIGFTGEFKPWHGIDDLLHVFKEIANNNFRLLLIGDGPIEKDLRILVQKLNLDKMVIFTGRIQHSKIVAFVEAMDIAVSPKATFYASPMKLLEYMALSKPIIAPKMENIEDLICNREEGLLFEPNNNASLKATLIELINDKELRKVLGKKARKKVELHHTWEKNAIKILNLVK